ncbi:hypothetical protein [Humibacter albus]|uniref:hypothetical protein n=1 Tax=Humibacter albus TaxID=427754 RepID=UPI0003B61800|nr:hypothetical protein [Humibacter albus]
MINHTMLVSFADPIADEDLDRYISDIGEAMTDTGVVRTFQAQRHIPIAGEDAIPAFIATVVLQLGVNDEADLAALFAAPRAGEVIHKWQALHPYEVAWVNHEAMA